MIYSSSSNAILAKSRAMYGRRLTLQNYEDLLNCRSVGEIATYLKNNTDYASIFEGVVTSTIHRGQLETLLRKRLFLQYASLCRYEFSIANDFYRYFIIINDIEQILTCIRLINTGHPGDYLFSLPAFFNKHTEIDLFKLAKANSFDALLTVLEGSDYKKVLEPFAKRFGEQNVSVDIEAAFYRYKYEHLRRLAEKAFKGRQRQEVLEILRMQSDMHSIVNIYRLKHLIKADKETIDKFVLRDISNLSQKQFDSLIQAKTAKEMQDSLNSTVYGKKFMKYGGFDFIEESAQRLLYGWNLKSLRFSTNPSIVMLCYMFLAENEIENITHIIEGIRYNVPTDIIRAMLIGVGD